MMMMMKLKMMLSATLSVLLFFVVSPIASIHVSVLALCC